MTTTVTPRKPGRPRKTTTRPRAPRTASTTAVVSSDVADGLYAQIGRANVDRDAAWEVADKAKAEVADLQRQLADLSTHFNVEKQFRQALQGRNTAMVSPLNQQEQDGYHVTRSILDSARIYSTCTSESEKIQAFMKRIDAVFGGKLRNL